MSAMSSQHLRDQNAKIGGDEETGDATMVANEESMSTLQALSSSSPPPSTSGERSKAHANNDRENDMTAETSISSEPSGAVTKKPGRTFFFLVTGIVMVAIISSSITIAVRNRTKENPKNTAPGTPQETSSSADQTSVLETQVRSIIIHEYSMTYDELMNSWYGEGVELGIAPSTNIDIVTELNNENSLYRQALDYLLIRDQIWDEWGKDPEDLQLLSNKVMSQRIVQRYVLTYFYFSVTWAFPWVTIRNPTNGTSDSATSLVGMGDSLATVGEHPWLSSSHECEWIGVICTSDTRAVVEISLTQSGLSGSFPTGILGHLPKLASLQLSGNVLTGTIPPHLWTSTPALFRVHLSDNRFTGSLADEWWQAAAESANKRGNISNPLLDIRLGGNQLEGSITPSLGLLGWHLRYLDLSHNNITGSLPDDVWSNLTSLQVLNLSHNALQGGIPESLGNLESIQELSLDGNNLSGSVPEAVCNRFYQSVEAHSVFVTDCTSSDASIPAPISCPCCTQCCTEANTCHDSA